MAVLVLMVSLAVGCGGSGPDDVRPGDRTPATAPPTTTSPAPPAVAEEPVEEDIGTAVSVVDRYWDRHWAELFTGTYRSPRILGGYDGAAASVPRCGGQPLADDNAVYCPARDFLAWDVDLMNAGHRAGDAWVYLVIAHEWGHAVQNRLDTQLVALQLELQADCLAGAVLFGAAADGMLRFEEGDTDELAQALGVLADDTPWTKASDHGDASERIGAFTRGTQDGVKGCLPT
ncbi:neutral zinc metallopeptidase [Streptomyces sp. 8N706]|uniref:neutral zinc metallopeptidase n=1 Tax=Streptomyces sp. 8N706 TaxID=3457416 RepID=UPI003FD6A48F